ncbi:type VII secretion target [Amycolatopsis cynarae]|uniref:Type VII secretion target n=1 Tax=Amycolatopsis cynarae TaxID=2995223 RepID=A0ABY7BDE4_9PSEU|nr:type VII secretion target [Amycolatopsis sp. HUAS 11-8]WAL69277.1 type VII secretion target [Amycolatopsis sp. HUAS 11-8]
MAQNGYQVDPQELGKFAGYLKGTTAPAVEQASSGVHDANGFDNSAFGIFAAQLLAVPARIAMGVVGDQLSKLSKEMTDAADRTQTAADTYTQHDQNVAADLGTFKAEV